MALFYGGATPLHRQLKGLLLPGLPRGLIPKGSGSAGGGAFPSPLAGYLRELLPGRPDHGGAEPRCPVQPCMVCRPIDHLQLIGLEA